MGCGERSEENNPNIHKEDKCGRVEIREPEDNFNNKKLRRRSN